MTPFQFDVKPHNAHCDTEYSQEMLKWRKLGAIEKANNICAVVNKKKFARVLEVGCGTGAVLHELYRLGMSKDLNGIDVINVERNKDAHRSIHLTEYDGKTIPFSDGSFDFTYATHVIEHVNDPRGLIREMCRVTNGLLYFEVPCELHARTRYKDLQSTLNIGHINAYTPESFSLLLQTTGLEIIELQIFDHTLDVHCFTAGKIKGTTKMAIRRTLLGLNAAFASRLFTYHCGALARNKT